MLNRILEFNILFQAEDHDVPEDITLSVWRQWEIKKVFVEI